MTAADADLAVAIPAPPVRNPPPAAYRPGASAREPFSAATRARLSPARKPPAPVAAAPIRGGLTGASPRILAAMRRSRAFSSGGLSGESPEDSRRPAATPASVATSPAAAASAARMAPFSPGRARMYPSGSLIDPDPRASPERRESPLDPVVATSGNPRDVSSSAAKPSAPSKSCSCSSRAAFSSVSFSSSNASTSSRGVCPSGTSLGALGCSLRTKSSTPTCPEGIGGRARLAAAEVDAFAFAVRPLSTFRLASAAIPFPTRERRRSSSGESSSSGMGTAGLATR